MGFSAHKPNNLRFDPLKYYIYELKYIDMFSKPRIKAVKKMCVEHPEREAEVRFMCRTCYNRSLRIKKRFGITMEELAVFCQSQGGRCVLCGATEKLVLDHNHETGKLRGLLCGHCNSMIGFARDNIVVLEKAIIYIRDNNGN